MIHNKKSSQKKKGFTLIELLVVIAIIGILSSIVIASLNSAREKSARARQLADIKSLHSAFEMYYNDNNKYPDRGVWTDVKNMTEIRGYLDTRTLSIIRDIGSYGRTVLYGKGDLSGDPTWRQNLGPGTHSVLHWTETLVPGEVPCKPGKASRSILGFGHCFIQLD